MSNRVKVAGFVAAIAAVFGLALLVGRVTGPVNDEVSSSHGNTHVDDGQSDSAQITDTTQIPGGLMVSQNGYAFALSEDRLAAGEGRELSFTITGPDGSPVTAFDVEHEKQLHLIAVRRDFTGFQHVHPSLGGDGIWSTDLDLTPGDWRVFADFKATGAEALTLGADLVVTGAYRPQPPAVESRTASVDGYEVALEGDLAAGTDAKLTLSVSKDGQPVTDLQPYLGAYGHLVALRGGDLAYLHVHPDGVPGDGATEPGPEVVFYAAVPSAGTYHLYLDFQHGGVVRTAAFTVTAGEADDAESDSDPTDESTADGGGHSGH